jgi:transcriptional regulator with XRE-family HTH domain
MRIRLSHPGELGPLVRAMRKNQGLRQDATAEGIGVSENFLSKVESGSDSVQWGKLFEVLKELGLHVEIDVPEAVMTRIQEHLKSRKR